jgi:hypothetical protein
VRFQQCNLSAGFGEMQRGGESGDSAAHDYHIGAALAVQRRPRQAGLGGFVV